MANVIVDDSYLQDIADSIREKTGSSEKIKPSEMSNEIDNLPSGGSTDLDWQTIGYDKRPNVIDYGYEYAQEIQKNWTPSTSLDNKFSNDKDIRFMPLVDTSTATSMQSMFSNCSSLCSIAKIDTSNVSRMNSMFDSCYALASIPLLNTSKVVNFQTFCASCQSLKEIPKLDFASANNFYLMFSGCSSLTKVPVLNIKTIQSSIGITNMFRYCLKLTDESLDNILQMCVGIESYSGTRKLSTLGINDSNVYPVSRIEALPHYQDFINAGWTIGY